MPEPHRKTGASPDFGDLDDVFAGKGTAKVAEPAAAPAPVAEVTTTAPRTRQRVAVKQEESAPVTSGYQLPVVRKRQAVTDDHIVTTFRYPRYVARIMEEWMLRNPGHSKTSMFLNGLKSMGMDIAEEDLVPRRPQGGGG